MPFTGIAPNKTFQRTDGTRTGTQTWQEADAADVDIVAPDHDTHDQDIGDAISSLLLRDGGNQATGNIPMGGFRFTNLGDAAILTQALTLKQKLNGVGEFIGTVGGTANAITLTTGFTLTAYVTGMRFTFVPIATNSSTATVIVDGISLKNITGPAAATLQAGQILINKTTTIVYDGTQFQVDTVAPVAVSVGMVMAWPASTIPTGWLECYGQAISRATYSDLFSVIGTTYGAGDASTTFNLPDGSNRTIFGVDTSASGRITNAGSGIVGTTLGATGGAEKVTLARANLPNDDVTVAVSITDLGHTHPLLGKTGSVGSSGSPAVSNNGSQVGAGNTSSATTGITASGQFYLNGNTSQTTVNKMPPAILFKWIILALPASTLPSLGGVITPTGGIAAAGGFSTSPRNWHTGNRAPFASTDGTNQTPVATEVYICEIFVPANATLTGVAIFNGSAVSGNVKVGLANSSGVVVATSASTAQSGTDAYQRVPFTATYAAVGPATYYVLVIIDNATGRLNAHPFGNFGASKQTGQVFATGFTTITPPTTFTADLGTMAGLY